MGQDWEDVQPGFYFVDFHRKKIFLKPYSDISVINLKNISDTAKERSLLFMIYLSTISVKNSLFRSF